MSLEKVAEVELPARVALVALAVASHLARRRRAAGGEVEAAGEGRKAGDRLAVIRSAGALVVRYAGDAVAVGVAVLATVVVAGEADGLKRMARVAIRADVLRAVDAVHWHVGVVDDIHDRAGLADVRMAVARDLGAGLHTLVDVREPALLLGVAIRLLADCGRSGAVLHLATEAADLCLPPLENFKIELTYIHKDGSLIPCESNVSILRDETGNVVAYEGITRDMRAWHAAMQRNERLSLLVAHSTNLIAITSQDGTITYLNPAGTRLLGAEPLIGRSIAEFLRFPEGRSFARDILPAVLADGYWQGGHELLPPGEQPPLFIESHIFPIRQPQAEQSGDLAFIMHDLTAHEAAATALKNSLSFLSALIETIPVPVFYKGTDLRYQGCNRLFADFVIGRPRSEFVGKRIDELDIELVPVDLAPIYQNADQELIATAGLQEYEAPVRCADGRRRDFILKKATYHDGAGQVAGILGIMQDITALRQNEEERQRMQEALRQAQKMDALGRLAGGVTHDFNNLLTAINGHVTLALMDTDPSDLRFESLNEIGRASSRASELTTHLMAFARQQQLNKRKVDLNQLIASMKTLFGRLLGEDIELSISPKAGLPAVWADPPQFEQILLNLVLNARDAMPRGGRLLISTDLLLPLAALDAAAPGTPQVVLRVADSGIGMSEEVRKRIFEPFFTTKPPQRASGLGLSTVYGIVAKHGGTIEVASELGQGTAFAISLPAEPEAVPQNDLAFAGLPEGRETILLVEDEKLVLNTALRILNRLGYNVLTAMDSEEAIELLQLRNVPIDLLLTDVILPGKSGVELSSRLKAERPALKILYISGYADDRLRKQGLRRKDIHFLGKPFTPSQLAVKLREVLDATS